MRLSRDDVLQAAMQILDSYGLADLTMRRLATVLGVQPGALYWHFANKQNLLAALADQILVELPSLDDGEWSTGLRAWARHFHALIRQHRSGAELVSSVLALRCWQDSPAYDLEQFLGRHGIDQATARAASAGLIHLVLGHAFDEEQADQLAELGVRDTGAPADSTQLLDAAVGLLIAGVGCTMNTEKKPMWVLSS